MCKKSNTDDLSFAFLLLYFLSIAICLKETDQSLEQRSLRMVGGEEVWEKREDSGQ